MANRTSILLPKVAPVVAGADPATDIKAVAERIDRVLTNLENQMQNFEAADASQINGVPAGSVVSGSNSMYFQTFEDDITEEWVFLDGTAAAITFPLNGQAGGHALRTTLTEVILEDNTYIPFDPSRLYRMRTRYRDISGAHNGAIVGVRCYDASKALIGTYQEVCLDVASNSSTSWTTVEGYFKGASSGADITSPSTDAYAPRALRTGTAYIRPFLHLSVGADDQTAELDYITLEILTETAEVDTLLQNVDGRAAGDVSSTVKSGGGVAASQVDNDAVINGELTAGKMDTLVGGGLTINFAATGTQKVLEHTNFYIQADGTAVFAGTVAATNFTGSTATFTGSVNIQGGTGDNVAVLGHVASYGGKIDLLTTTASKSQWRIYNRGGNDLWFEQPALLGDYDGDAIFIDSTVVSGHGFHPLAILTNDTNSNIMDVFDDDGHFHNVLKTNNTSSTTMLRMSTSSYRNHVTGMWVFIIMGDANTTWDFSTGTYLFGNGGVDYSPASGEVMLFLCTDGSNNKYTWVNNP